MGINNLYATICNCQNYVLYQVTEGYRLLQALRTVLDHDEDQSSFIFILGRSMWETWLTARHRSTNIYDGIANETKSQI